MPEPMYQKAVVIVAGGSGKRMKSDIPKQFLLLAGCPILIHTVRCFLEFDKELHIALVLPQSSIQTWDELSHRWLALSDIQRVHVCEGGVTRSDSVYQGLNKLVELFTSEQQILVAIHDGVRPFATPNLLNQAFYVAKVHGASVACIPVKASLRLLDPSGSTHAVDRANYLEVQTPQTFFLNDILNVFRQRPNDSFTDDASLYEYFGNKVAISEGSYDNIKITTPEDLELAEKIYLRLRQLDVSELTSKIYDIKLLLLDVDGTLTDGGLWIGPSGETVKKFFVKDSLAIRRLIHRHEVEVGLISSGNTPDILAEIAKEWGIQLTHAGKIPKIKTMERWAKERQLSFNQIAYIGDDLNDLAVIQQVGLSACPADATPEIQAAADIILKKKGGEGCVREFIEEVMKVPLG